MTNQVLATLNERKHRHRASSRSPAAALAELIARGARRPGLNKQRAREVYAADAGRRRHGASEAIDASWASRWWPTRASCCEIVRRAIAANPKAVADFKKGKIKAADAIKGAVMRETKGMAKIEVVQQLLMEELQKSDSPSPSAIASAGLVASHACAAHFSLMNRSPCV